MVKTIRPRLPNRRIGPASANRPAAKWAAWILIFYVIYLGLILPFVCWGALGTPGHPHPVAHFVFAMPEIPHADPLNLDQIPGLSAFVADAAHADHTAQADPAGQSRPDTTLISLLLLVFVGLRLHSASPRLRFSRLWTDHNWRSVFLPIPTPPPRA
jgi:hypothetical protein